MKDIFGNDRPLITTRALEQGESIHIKQSTGTDRRSSLEMEVLRSRVFSAMQRLAAGRSLMTTFEICKAAGYMVKNPNEDDTIADVERWLKRRAKDPIQERFVQLVKKPPKKPTQSALEKMPPNIAEARRQAAQRPCVWSLMRGDFSHEMLEPLRSMP